MKQSIASLRKKKLYRFLEGFLGYVSIFFLIFLLILGFVYPTILALFLICYSFFMLFKISLHSIYSIYNYKTLRRWESFDWIMFYNNLKNSPSEAANQLKKIQRKYENNFDWKDNLEKDIKNFENIILKKDKIFKEVFHIPIFSIYNESTDVVSRSLEKIYKSKYDLTKILIVVSQEARMGDEFNDSVVDKIKKLSWVNVNTFFYNDVDFVYNNNYSNYNSNILELKSIKFNNDKLNILFTRHPDGLVGEIKGKASNEDWAGRIASLYCKNNQIDTKKVVVTSLDADSKIGDNFFQILTYRFCLTKDRENKGYQPLPIYSNNYLSANLFPRLVASNTTIWYMIQSTLTDELHFFANYSIPLSLLEKIDFWNREVIAEDSLLFSKCFINLSGEFQVIPFYGTFEGDAVVGEDYFETIKNQYLQLQRWAWGGIEGFPYKFWYFFCDKDRTKIDLRKRINLIRLEAINHFFWSTSPIVFSLLMIFPHFITSNSFKETPIQYNFFVISQYIAWISFIFIIVSGFITFQFIVQKAKTNEKIKWYHFVVISLQWVVSPFIYIFWSFPALDVQIRGILGKYLGYWVTPKKIV